MIALCPSINKNDEKKQKGDFFKPQKVISKMETARAKENPKNVKKALDKQGIVCYYIGALEARVSMRQKTLKNFEKSKKST